MHWDINTWLNFGAFIAFPVIVAVWRSLKGEFKARDERIEASEVRIGALVQTFNDYRVEVSEKYATNSYLREVEARIAQRFDEVSKKLDRLIERNQRRDGDA